MLGKKIRAWGTADWLLSKYSIKSWTILGSISTEDRCIAPFEHVSPQKRNLHKAYFLDIEDVGSPFLEECRVKRANNREAARLLAQSKLEIIDAELLQSPIRMIRLIDRIAAEGNENVILDVSTLPKRFFFPILRQLIENDSFKNVLVAYTAAEKYGEELAYNPAAWAHLPTFQRVEDSPTTAKCEQIIVGVGFVPFALPELLKHDYQGAIVNLLFPFPPGPPQVQRNWQFVELIENTCKLNSDENILRVGAMDVSGCFDLLEMLTNNGQRKVVLAPYGPKPHSVAMCLFGIKHGCDIYYTQPAYYSPNYSSGTKRANGIPQSWTYTIKREGVSLY